MGRENNLANHAKYTHPMQGELFNCEQTIPYPPFKDGLYMEEYCVQRYIAESPITKRTYIPVKWTNFQNSSAFYGSCRMKMQTILDAWIQSNPNSYGYYTIVQHDDGPALKLPINTIVYGACTGDIQIPLIYEDKKQRLISLQQKQFQEKPILCSFVGTFTHKVRRIMQKELSNNRAYKFSTIASWNATIPKVKQNEFITITQQSKFAFAPRGYGRSSFRFYEILQLGTIPVYVWDDIEWLPYKDQIDYTKFCISIHIEEIHTLEAKLKSINEQQYAAMLEEYEKIKHMFTYDGMHKYILEHVDTH